MDLGEKILNRIGFYNEKRKNEKQERIKDLEKRIKGLKDLIRNMVGVPQERDLVSTETGEILDDASLLRKHQTNLRKLEDELERLRATK